MKYHFNLKTINFISKKLMKKNHIIVTAFLLTGIIVAMDDFATTKWEPNGDQKFVQQGTKVITKVNGKTENHTIGPGEHKGTVELNPAPQSKVGWVRDHEETIYRFCSTGISFGADGFSYYEQKNNGNFRFGFDVKPDGSTNKKEATLYGQVILKGEHQKTKEQHSDIGIAGKDTSVTITLDYDKKPE